VKDFKAFLLRGNVVDLAVGIVIGAAFGALVVAFTGAFITPLLGAVLGNSDMKTWVFTVGGVTFPYGGFIDSLIAFVVIAAVVFFFVVRPMVALQERQKRGVPEDPTERPCPECLSPIPVGAKRCAFCTSEIGAATA
jgi:large conductance mechanosensitive channel